MGVDLAQCLAFYCCDDGLSRAVRIRLLRTLQIGEDFSSARSGRNSLWLGIDPTDCLGVWLGTCGFTGFFCERAMYSHLGVLGLARTIAIDMGAMVAIRPSYV